MRKLFIPSLLLLTMVACKSGSNDTSSPAKSVMGSIQEKKLQAIVTKELKSKTITSNEFIAMVDGDEFEATVEEIVANGGEIININKRIGYVSFKSSASAANNMIESKKFSSLTFNEEMNPALPKYEAATASADGSVPQTKGLYPREIMNIDPLVEQMKADGINLDGSSSTIAVFDTGVDISRTDIFQDRIVELHTLRYTDNAKVVEAESEVIGGVEYLTSVIDGLEVKIERTERLSADRQYYVGYFSEKQLEPTNNEKIDLNQDGQVSAVFPVVAYKNDEGQFEVFVNVNSSLTYGEAGDNSIEDENLLMDFNWVAKNIEDRYQKASKEIYSYYKYTTQLDVIRGKSLSKRRNKGKVNLAITIGSGKELDSNGDFVNKARRATDSKVYNIGLVGFDQGGHGTHVAGIAAGNFINAPQFSSGAKNSKVIGVSMLGVGHSKDSFYSRITDIAENHKNVVFNFSFGSNRPNNIQGGPTGDFHDKISKEYGVVFVKSAGNEGPGVNSHGTSISQWMLAVANYYSANARNSYQGGDVAHVDNKIWVSPSSSRGPMIDGALKPDIGAPGWVMSSVPLAVGKGEKFEAFAFWPGTSMAAPNASSVVALLFDAATKTGVETPEGKSTSISIDKVHRAIKNSAIAYDKYIYAECVGTKGDCKLEKKERDFKWIEGGAGRINALGAWQVIEDIVEERESFVNVTSRSYVSGFEGWGIGHYSIDFAPEKINFWVSRDNLKTLDDMVSIKSFRMKLPADIDWLSFSPTSMQKEKIIEVLSTDDLYQNLFVRKDKLTKNGRIKHGVHTALLKAYPLDSDKYFDWVFPVTIVGSASKLDRAVDGNNLNVQGFVAADQFASYTVEVKEDGANLLLNLNASNSNPGSVMMKVYHRGMELHYTKMNTKSYWATSDDDFYQDRNRVQYLLKDLEAGHYEIIVKAGSSARAIFENTPGSFFDLGVSKVQLRVEDTELYKSTKGGQAYLSGVQTDHHVAIKRSIVYSNKLKMSKSIQVFDKQVVQVEFDIVEAIDTLVINTVYFGVADKMDIDIELKNAEGQTIASSGKQDSFEQIVVAVKDGRIGPGRYTLEILGYAVPVENDAIDFSIVQYLNASSGVLLSNSFKDPRSDKMIGGEKGGYVRAGKKYDLVSKFDLAPLENMPKAEGFEPVISLKVSAKVGNDAREITLISKDLSKSKL